MLRIKRDISSLCCNFLRLRAVLAAHFVKHPLLPQTMFPIVYLAVATILCIVLLRADFEKVYLFILPFIILPICLAHSEKLFNTFSWVSLFASLVSTFFFLMINQTPFLQAYGNLVSKHPSMFTKIQNTIAPFSYSKDIYNTLSLVLPSTGMILYFKRLTKLYSYTPYSEWNNWSVDYLKLKRHRYIAFTLCCTLFWALFGAISVLPMAGIDLPLVESRVPLWAMALLSFCINFLFFLVCTPDHVFTYKDSAKNKVATTLGRKLLIRTHPEVSFRALKSKSIDSIVVTMFSHLRHVFMQDTLDNLPYIKCVLNEYAKKLTAFFEQLTRWEDSNEKKEATDMCHNCLFALGIAVAHLSHGESYAAHQAKNWRIREMVDSVPLKTEYLTSLQYGYAIGETYQIRGNDKTSTQANFQQLQSESDAYFASIAAKSPRMHNPSLVTEIRGLNKSSDTPPIILVGSPSYDPQQLRFTKKALGELVEPHKGGSK